MLFSSGGFEGLLRSGERRKGIGEKKGKEEIWRKGWEKNTPFQNKFLATALLTDAVDDVG